MFADFVRVVAAEYLFTARRRLFSTPLWRMNAALRWLTGLAEFYSFHRAQAIDADGAKMPNAPILTSV
jgi:hypothetical protein